MKAFGIIFHDKDGNLLGGGVHDPIVMYMNVTGPFNKNLDGKGKEPKSSIWVDRMEREGPFYGSPASFESTYLSTLGNATQETEKTSVKEKQENDERAVRFLNEFMTEAFRHREPARDFVRISTHFAWKIA